MTIQACFPTSTILLTGATGYVGGRLAPRLLEAGHRVRCVTRSAAKLRARPWAMQEGVEMIEADMTDGPALARAMRGCTAAFYLVHSMMAAGERYRLHDRRLAETFAGSASQARLPRIVYLGGLGETGKGLSEHLSSRREVEEILSSGSAAVTVLRAAMIIGSGSASFEILRYLVERLPIMVTPRWVDTESQPIAIRNVLHYLIACLHAPETIGQTLDIGGPEVITYRELMQQTARALGLRPRRVIPVPVLTPRLSSLWIHLVTPLSHQIARPLAEGLRNRVVCRDDRAARLMPQRLLPIAEAIGLAVQRQQAGLLETSCFDAGAIPGDPTWAGGTVYSDSRVIRIDAPAAEVFQTISSIGGDRGYYAADWLWRLRGLIDRFMGGPGLRRGRRRTHTLSDGDSLDFWRVAACEPPHRLVLRAEMRLPGLAELSFTVTPCEDKAASTLTQTARFHPRGLSGILYWYALLPLHEIVFRGMLDGIRHDAERRARAARGVEPAPGHMDPMRRKSESGTAPTANT